MKMGKKADIDWSKLGFDYIKTDYRYVSVWKDGKWDEGTLTTDNTFHQLLQLAYMHL